MTTMTTEEVRLLCYILAVAAAGGVLNPRAGWFGACVGLLVYGWRLT